MPWSFRGHPDPHHPHPRRFHRQFRAARRLHRTRSWASFSTIASARPTARCAASSCRTAATPPMSRPISPRSARPSRRTARPIFAVEGQLQRPQAAGDSAIVTFDDYAIDLSQFIAGGDSITPARAQRPAELLAPDPRIEPPASRGHIRAELLDRLTSPLYAFVAGLIAFAALGEARTTRQGRGVAIGGAILAFAASAFRHRRDHIDVGVPPAADISSGAIPLAAASAPGCDLRRRLARGLPPAPSRRRPGDDRRQRFRSIWRIASRGPCWRCSPAFSLSSSRSISSRPCGAPGDTPKATAVADGWLSFLHTPTVAEQALPFAVLFGSMIAFLNLSRRLELVVARAAGVSVWQFLAPPLVVSLLIGVVSVTPTIRLGIDETASGRDRGEHLRRRGPSRAAACGFGRRASMAKRSSTPSGRRGRRSVSPRRVFNFDDRAPSRAGRRRRGDLQDGYLGTAGRQDRNARIRNPDGFGPICWRRPDRRRGLAGLRRARNRVVLELAELAEQTERAGLDATAYRLRYQELSPGRLMLAAMVLVAACFSLRFFRMGGVENMVSGGVAAGFVLYVATKVVGDLGERWLHQRDGRWVVAGVVGCLFGVYVLLQQEDG